MKQPLSREAKNAQIKKEALATLALFFFCCIWHVGFGFALAKSSVTVFHLPLWWVVSTPGVFVIALVGITILVKKVFVNFSLEDEEVFDD